MGGDAHACAYVQMLRLGRPVGVFPRLEARLAEIRIGGRDVEAAEEEGTGCAECGGSKDAVREEPCSDDGDTTDGNTTDGESDCGCSEDTGKAWDKSCWNDEFALDF
tara:strand:- start:58 stop:378 length:321 start_codon:yes stop_codon:yes gene_type:complete